MTFAAAASRVKEIRRVLGNRSQKEAGAAIGVSEATWQRMEAGDGLPKGETLVGLAKLGFSPTWILTGQGPMRISPEAPVATGAAPPRRLADAVNVDWLSEALAVAIAQARSLALHGDMRPVLKAALVLYDLRALQQPAAEEGSTSLQNVPEGQETQG